MAATYEPIASVTLSVHGLVDFTSIPSNYTDLVIAVMAKSNQASGTTLYMRFNSDTGTNYSITRLRGDGSAASSNRGANLTYLTPANLSAESGEFSTYIINVMNYANANVYKTILASGANSESDVRRAVGLWRDLTAISTIRVSSTVGGLEAGSTASLYGIKAA